MSLLGQIEDGDGTGRRLKIYPEGQIALVMHSRPPDDDISSLPFANLFYEFTDPTNTNMAQNGSVTNVDFVIEANQDYDIYIRSIQVQLGGTGAVALNKFADIAALTNGIEFFHYTTGDGRYLIDTIKTNIEFMKLATGKDDFGTSTDAFRADVSGAGENTYLPEIDIALRFGMPWGLRLRKGTTSRLGFTIKDDLSTIATFNIKGYGFRF